MSAQPAYWDAKRSGGGNASPSDALPPTNVVEAPAPSTCVACGGRMTPWIVAEPQEPTLDTGYRLRRCPNCGTASTAGAPQPELHESGVYESDTTRLAPLVEAVRRSYEGQRLRILRRAQPAPARVLDAGAGQGRFVVAAARAGYQASGIEPSRRAVEIASTRGVSLRHASLESAEIESGSLDAVVLSHVLEHLEDPGAAIARIATWLRPGGVLLVGVPNIASVQAAIGGDRWLHLDVPRHRHHFTPSGLDGLLARHGFAIEDEHHFLIEHNLFGMWQTFADRLTSTPAYAYNLVKRNVPLRPRNLAATLVAGLLLPVAAIAETVAALLRRGGTIVVVARRQ